MERQLEAALFVGGRKAVDREVRGEELLLRLLRGRIRGERRHVVDVAGLVELIAVLRELVDDQPIPDPLERVRIGEERVDVEAPLRILVDLDVGLVRMRVGDDDRRLVRRELLLRVEDERRDPAQIVEADADRAGRSRETLGHLRLERVEILHLALRAEAVRLRLEHVHRDGDARGMGRPRLLLEIDDERGGRSVDIRGVEGSRERGLEIGGRGGSRHASSIARSARFT